MAGVGSIHPITSQFGGERGGNEGAEMEGGRAGGKEGYVPHFFTIDYSRRSSECLSTSSGFLFFSSPILSISHLFCIHRIFFRVRKFSCYLGTSDTLGA